MRKPNKRSCVRLLPALIVVGLLLLPVISLAIADETITWVDSTRDLYIDGRLDRGAQLFLAEESEQAAIMSDALPGIVVFDRETLAVGTLDKTELVLTPDLTNATSARLSSLNSEGEVLRVDDRSFLLRFSDHTVLVAPHQGNAGEISRDLLWSTAPVWRARADAYEPDPESLSALRTLDRDVELTVVFGTWCGDSKEQVPALLKTVDLAANSRIRLRLISIRSGFEEPLDFVRDQKVINVPTIIVTAGDEEIGRFIETPALDSVEADLAAILAGRPPIHEGRWKRERRLARGTYHYLDGDHLKGTEEWEIFAAPDDTTLVHSQLQIQQRTTEIWHRHDADSVTNFVEITRQDGGDLSRSRFWIEEGRLQSITRGNATGIVEQTMELPDGWMVLLPSAVTTGRPANGTTAPAFQLSVAGAPASGRLNTLEFDAGESEEIATPAGLFDAERVLRRVDGSESVWWLHSQLGVPVQGQLEDGVRIVLAEFEQFADDGSTP